MSAALPARFAEIRDEFHELDEPIRLELLLEHADALAEPPAEFRDRPELLERVEECQSPVFIRVENTADGVRLIADAPPQAPTTRGFASILQSGVDGLSVAEVLALPDDLAFDLGLTKVVSPLRLRGMSGMLARIKRQLRAADPARP